MDSLTRYNLPNQDEVIVDPNGDIMFFGQGDAYCYVACAEDSVECKKVEGSFAVNNGKMKLRYENGDVLTFHCDFEENMTLYIKSE